MTTFNADTEDDNSDWNPLESGAAPPPPVRGGGCLARFDPQTLNEESGADFSDVADQLQGSTTNE
jgi:hypothetical protein